MARRSARGAVSILFVLMLAVMIGAAGLGIDVGRLYLARAETQNAADACALAAAAELDGEALEAARAQAAGLAVAKAHTVLLQSVAFTDADVTVSNPVGSPAAITCTVASPAVSPFFLQMLGVGDSSPRAAATATTVKSQCLSPGVSGCLLAVPGDDDLSTGPAVAALRP
jgi:uncharacterized membrane protein